MTLQFFFYWLTAEIPTVSKIKWNSEVSAASVSVQVTGQTNKIQGLEA